MPVNLPTETVLALSAVTKQYANQAAPALSEVSLSLARGELLSLLGPSGCGKTTLLRLVAGFERPQAGLVELAGRQVCGDRWVPPEQRDVGVVFQDYALFPHLTVLRNVAFGLVQGRRLAQAKAHELAHEAIALVGLKGFEQRYPHELSGGQQQRVALARALAPRPSLVLLDEPFSNLDVQVRLYLRQEVRDILKNVGTAGLFVTHDQEEALAIADRVAVLRQGRIEQVGPPETLYREPASRFVAAFITQANFFSARACAQGWETAIGLIPAFQVQLNASGDRPSGELMIRQEALRLVPDLAGNAMVKDRLFLGREYQYRVQILGSPDGQIIYIRTPLTQQFPSGERVRVQIATNSADCPIQFFAWPKGEADLTLAPLAQPTVSARS